MRTAIRRARNFLEERHARSGVRRGGGPGAPLAGGVARVRDAFRVEALEPRVLLSADPLFSPLKAFFLPDEGQPQQWDYESEQRETGQKAFAPADLLHRLLTHRFEESLDLSGASQAYVEAPSSASAAVFVDGLAQAPTAAALDLSRADIFSAASAHTLEGPRADLPDLAGAFPGLTWGETAGQNDPASIAPWHVALEEPQASTEEAIRLDSGTYDLASWVAGGDGQHPLWLGQGAVLKGSGDFGGDLTVEGLLSPGYSPGVQNVSTLSLTSTSTTLFEIGGPTAGTGTAFYDQINVSGQASLDGTISVDLINNYRPSDGQVFNVLNYGSVSGAFARGTGLIDAGEGVFFEVVGGVTGLSLKAHVLDASTAELVSALSSAVVANDQALHDRIGQWLNFDYFRNNSSFSFTGQIDLGQGVSLSGSATLGFTNNVTIGSQVVDVFTLGLENANGFIGLDPNSTSAPGLRFTDADLGVLWLRSENPANDGGWVWAEGTVSGLTLVGNSGVSLTASSLTLDFAQGLGTVSGQTNNSLLNLSGTPRTLSVGSATYTFDSADTAERAAASGTVSLALGSVLNVSGTAGFASSASGLWVAGSNISARMSAGGASLGLDSGNFGLVIYTDNSYQLEASGSLFLSGGGFAQVSATSALLRLNTTGVSQAERVLQVGGYSHTLSAMSALSDPVLRVTGLQARIGDVLAVSGDLSFERDAASGNLEVLASNASASVRAGDLVAGVSQANLALVIRDANVANGGVLLEATGAADMALGESVQISATAATVRWNSTNLDASARAINVAGTAYT
jgi:hypothetical protein